MFHVEQYIYFIVLFHNLYSRQNYSGEAINTNIGLNNHQFNPTQPHDDYDKCKYHSSIIIPI